METRQLRYFLAVAQYGTVTGAAKNLSIAQPALSVQIAKLESDLGYALFERGARGVRLTPAGERLREHAKQILDQIAAARREMDAMSHTSPVEITIGIPTLVSRLLIAPLLRETRNKLPSVNLRVIEAMGASLRNQLDHGNIDLAVLYRRPADRPDPPDVFLEEDLHLVLARDYPAHPSCEMASHQLADFPLALSTAGNSHRDILEAHARRCGMRLNIVAEVDSIAGQRQLVLTGTAATILPLSGLADWPSEAFSAIRLRRPELVSRMIFATRPHSSKSDTIESVQNSIRSIVASMVRSGEWPDGRIPVPIN